MNYEFDEAVAKEQAEKFECERCGSNIRLFKKVDEIVCSECLKKETNSDMGLVLETNLKMSVAMELPYSERTNYCLSVSLPVPLYAMIGEGRIDPKEE